MLESITNETCSNILQTCHPSVSKTDYRILRNRHSNNKVKRKVSLPLLIRKHQPLLNMHENLVPLELLIDLCVQ